jgi:hypothetical protein
MPLRGPKGSARSTASRLRAETPTWLKRCVNESPFAKRYYWREPIGERGYFAVTLQCLRKPWRSLGTNCIVVPFS